jgi:PAP2 superfamily
MTRGVRQALRDAAPVAAVLALCPLAAAFAPGPAGPLARIEALVGDERSLNLFFEPALHRWFAAHPPLMGLANFAYVGIHLPVMLGVLVWVWLKRPGAFRLARNTFVAAQALITAGYVLVPTAPPRMVAAFGYGLAPTPGVQGLERLAISPYSAMPSGHTAFALIAAGIVATLARHRLVRWAALLYPPLVLCEIYATGNHIWLDSVAGAACAGAGFAAARAIERPGRLAPEPAVELV